MGKKSKKKGGGKSSKAARKEKIHERREQQLEDLDYPDNKRPFFEGDRVWFHEESSWGDGSNPNKYRGIVKSVQENSLDIIPLQSKIDGHVTPVRISLKDVFPDFCDMTLRFDVGDDVVCGTDRGWVTETVKSLWPIGEDSDPTPIGPEDPIPRYRCVSLTAPYDNNNCIMKHPSSFRFDVGDRVVFDPAMAEAKGNSAAQLRSNSSSWLKGNVTSVDVTGLYDYYAAYGCSFVAAGKQYSCHIVKDDDEHVARSDANPRDRLLEAIEQDCSIYHLNYLTTTFKIDVTAFRDLVISKALEHASYFALSWLEHYCNINIRLIKDDSGNNLIHKIASSSYATRFIKEAGRVNFINPRPDWDLRLFDSDLILSNSLNTDGETWLQILVRRGDVKALDAALSPHCGLAWVLMFPCYFDKDKLALFADSIRDSGSAIMQCIFDSFVSFRSFNEQCQKIQFQFIPEDDLLQQDSMTVFRGENAFHHAQLLVRFFLDWRSHSNGKLSTNPFTSLIKKGSFNLFSLLYDANDRLFLDETYRLFSNEDRNEYIQPELTTAPDDDSHYEPLQADICMACIIGDNGCPSPCMTNSYEKNYYLQCLRQHAVSCDPDDCPSLLSHLKGMEFYYNADRRFREKRFWVNKICMLEDDKNLKGRLKILNYLLQRKPNTNLNVLDAIRHRQCGVLRFMTEKGFVQLEAKASSDRIFMTDASKLQFLERCRIPSSMTTACFLCFAAVEFDDLQSLQWICESFGTPVELCDGLSLLHFAAVMGRIEIVAWLYTQPVWHTLAMEVCRRKPFQNAFAVHIAASLGHIFLAEMMLVLQVPAEDSKGKLPDQYAKRSQHEFVKQWAIEREKPFTLERDIKTLLHLVKATDTTPEKLKHFINTSKCLEAETWDECEYSIVARDDEMEEETDMKGPMGYSLGEVLRECSRFSDQGFVLWLCNMIYFQNNSDVFWGSRKKKTLSCDNLLSFAESEGYHDLAKYLQKRWLKDISCVDPLTRNFLLESALGKGTLLLGIIWAKMLRAIILLEMIEVLSDTFRELIQQGGGQNELHELLCMDIAVKKSLIDEGYAESNYKYDLQEISSLVHPIDMSATIYGMRYHDGHLLTQQLAFRGDCRLSKTHIVLATEGFAELVEYCLRNMQGWTIDMEMDVVRIASFFGHSTIVDSFLDPNNNFLSDKSDCVQAAILGAGEACRYRDLLHLVEMHCAPYDPVKEEPHPSEDTEEGRNQSKTFMRKSLICAVLNGYARECFDYDIDDKKELKTLRLLVDKLNYTHDEILYAMRLMLSSGYRIEWVECIVDLFQNMIEALNLQPIVHHEQMQNLCKEIVVGCEREYRWRKECDQLRINNVLEWLEQMADLGIDIQNLVSKENHCTDENPFPDQFHKLEKRQIRSWSQFDVVKNGRSLDEIQDLIERGTLLINSRDRGGLLLTHLSSAYNRVDLLKWLVVTKGMNINSKDGQGRSALDVAKAAQAASATKWIAEWQAKKIIATFVQRNYRRLLATQKQQRSINAATSIQNHCRGYLVRKLYSGSLAYRLEESHRFSAVWGELIQPNHNLGQLPQNWSSIREKVSDIKNAGFMYDESYFEDTDEQLSKALEGALKVDDDRNTCNKNINQLLPNQEEESLDDTEENESCKASWLAFKLTSHVVKFLKRGDPKYKAFFVRRMQQLADGERSRILQKRLKGSQSTIYETYLEQKSGFRILWTEEGDNIVIWFVAKHKEVSRLMKLIDDCKSRTARQQLPESVISDLQHEDLLPSHAKEKKGILLDVFGNVPLKLYDVNFHSINDITMESWTPKLHLTEEERDVVKATGTVLVLGRSGTGKTICICNRMEYDRQKAFLGQDSNFSQLFVARSKRLCRYVAEAVGRHDQNAFQTFEDLVYEIDMALPRIETNGRHFFPSQRIDFHRFKQEFYGNQQNISKGKKVSALIVWTVIRSFIKGSVEAFQSPDGILPKGSFVAVEKLGKNRCRVPLDLRENIYTEYVNYEKYKKELGLWDDCDRVRDLLLRLDELKRVDLAAFDQVRRSRVYVDEVQDYTQIECLLFFYLGGPGGLFLAGDPAQSVVEGTEFRFEEMRSVGHFVAGSDRRSRDLIPQKPKTVNVNFRSHSGILNTAASFLEFLFRYYPGSAKQLKKDHGLFQGSRPGVLHRVNVNQLAALLSDKLKGAVVLVHDESAQYWRRALGDYKLVYGIREAKGLEFKSVILLNFFHELPSYLHKPWRNLLLDREGLDFETKYPLVGTQLKLLYTGITRCIERLFFVETSSSIAGDTTVRWLTTSSVKNNKPGVTNQGRQNPGDALATRNNINDIEAMSMTSDEFVIEGFNNAEMAESAELNLE